MLGQPISYIVTFRICFRLKELASGNLQFELCKKAMIHLTPIFDYTK